MMATCGVRKTRWTATNRARQVAGFAERENAARRDEHLHCESARAGNDCRERHQRGAGRPDQDFRGVGKRQLRGGGVRQDAEAGQHQQQVQQAGDREAAQDADRQVAPRIPHLAGDDRGDVEADAGEERELQRVRKSVRLTRLAGRNVVPSGEPEAGERDQAERQHFRDREQVADPGAAGDAADVDRGENRT